MKAFAIVGILLYSFSFGHAQMDNSIYSRFIPKGYELLDAQSGDMNQDGLTDYVIICKSPNEIEEEVKRPVLILHGTANGGLNLFSRNDNVALSYFAGGPMGDPYTGMTIKKNFFSIEHMGGGGSRFTRIITFKYDSSTLRYVLHKDAGDSWNTSNPNKSKTENYNKKNWGSLLFQNYTNE
ncbi:MAG: hypothetical protein ACK5DB_00090 [Ignavibacteria bacterium]|jgi:hypothetical protein